MRRRKEPACPPLTGMDVSRPWQAARRQREAREAVCNDTLVLHTKSNMDIFSWCTAPDCEARMGAKQ